MEMNQMKRKVLSLAMIAALCLTMLPTAGWAADAPVEYIDFDENGVQITEPRSCDQYSLVTENNTEWNASDENNGWYVVSGEVTIGKKEAPQRVTVSGDVHLILANDAKLTVNGGISVNAGNSLTVYAQPAENDKTTGSLTVENVEEGNAGIGGDVQQSGDTITINGGEITATGGTSGSGIGGGSKINGSGGTITINGGEITANGGDNGAGIGGGSASSGGIITINGGTIATTGGNLGAGIGSLGAGGTIEINGGDITATGGNLGAGIGGGDNDSGGEITINGDDKIIATGNGGGAGIGGGNYGAGGMIEINGGNITANGQGSSSACGGAGIGGGSQQSGGTITIHGGEIVATGYSGSAGIGSGFAASIGSATVINIDGGIVTATCSDDALETLGGAGIGGGGAANSSVAITISGGTVTATGGKGADGIGNGGGKSSSAQPATFSTGEDGNAVIYATAGEGTDTEAIVGKDDTSNWRGVIFLGNDGKIYGDSVTPNENFSVPESSTLTIESGKTLVVADEITLTNEGTITGSGAGAIRLYGTLTGKGTIESVQQVHPVRNLSLSETNLNMTVGDEPATLTATVEPTDATNPTVTWSSSNDSVVTVADGKVTAVAAGSATITAISVDDPDIKATCAVTVKEAGNPDPGTDPEEPGTDPDPEPGTDPDDPSTEPDDPAEDEPSDTPSTPVIPSEPDPEIEVTEPAHGDVEISPSKPEAGETVTITPTPDDGYEVEDVIVTDEDGECVPVRENPDGSWSYEQPKSDVTIEVIFGEVAPEPTVDVSEIFLDVDPDAWYKDAVQFVYDNGLMTGTSATEFAPDVTTTRAMIVSILARLEGVTAADDAGFTDVDDEWFATAVNWAASAEARVSLQSRTVWPQTVKGYSSSGSGPANWTNFSSIR